MIFAIIVAAGKGERAGGGQAKQFREVSGAPIIIHTLSRFEQCASVGEVVLVAPADACGEALALAAASGMRKVSAAVAGGETRAESVWNGLRAVGGRGAVADDIIAVHDGVRPFVTPEEIDRVVREAEASGAAILAAPVVDTIKEVERGRVTGTPERRKLWRAQTPQCFRFGLLRRAYEQALASGLDATDDSALVERLGVPVSVVEGGARNVKITTPQDFALAEVLVQSSEFKVQS
jgi:2-C-methyl-D-erythritol 4-phosphate cytidylyltransferase